MKTEHKDQIAREAIGLAFTLITIGLIVTLQDREALRLIKLRGMLALKRTAQAQSDAWQWVADSAASSYQKAKL